MDNSFQLYNGGVIRDDKHVFPAADYLHIGELAGFIGDIVVFKADAAAPLDGVLAAKRALAVTVLGDGEDGRALRGC